MSTADKQFDVIVIGAGHAGCEAALAAARLGKRTILFATNLDTIAFLACNPSIGGTAKGIIVKEIDALGGEMAANADKTVLQLRMLNLGKGPAVHCPRAQVDKNLYHREMKRTLEQTQNLWLRQGEVVRIVVENNSAAGVALANGLTYYAPCVVVATGVYLNAKTITGELVQNIGPNGFAPANALSQSLEELGLQLRRFKTGTPARIHSRSVDFNKTEVQHADNDIAPFSYRNEKLTAEKTVCHLTYSTPETKKAVLENIERAPVYSGVIEGTGPRYCPSIEDKIVRFSDKERHPVFLEPESADNGELYVQGVSSSMPADVQEKIYKTIIGLENVEIMRDAYAIEYDCIDSTELFPSLMHKKTNGLFFAGQVNGTSGYEEAAAQGLVAGINAVRLLDKKPPFVPDRASSYIGVLIDDLTTKGTNEPYRMMTGRAEYRLLLRQDNADTRLTQYGRDIGLVGDGQYQSFLQKQQEIAEIKQQLSAIKKTEELRSLFERRNENIPLNGMRLSDMLKRSNISLSDLQEEYGLFMDKSRRAKEESETDVKYEGYISRQAEQIEQFRKTESAVLPDEIDYNEISGLRLEARQKLSKIRPANIGQASRISGVSPADITVLLVYLSLERKK